MAKKTIISDFSALKGKVTFSEKTPDTKLSAKVSSAPTSKPKDSKKGLKVGQCVVLMDSNLRGKIIKLGRAVKIEKELDEVLALRCSYSVGDPAVTIVTIK